MDKPRVVVCSAIRNSFGDIITGARHFDGTMVFAIRHYGILHWDTSEQGFIDQFGVFMSREEAWVVAQEAGQIKYRCGGDQSNGGTLYSENLY